VASFLHVGFGFPTLRPSFQHVLFSLDSDRVVVSVSPRVVSVCVRAPPLVQTWNATAFSMGLAPPLVPFRATTAGTTECFREHPTKLLLDGAWHHVALTMSCPAVATCLVTTDLPTYGSNSYCPEAVEYSSTGRLAVCVASTVLVVVILDDFQRSTHLSCECVTIDQAVCSKFQQQEVSLQIFQSAGTEVGQWGD